MQKTEIDKNSCCNCRFYGSIDIDNEYSDEYCFHPNNKYGGDTFVYTCSGQREPKLKTSLIQRIFEFPRDERKRCGESGDWFTPVKFRVIDGGRKIANK